MDKVAGARDAADVHSIRNVVLNAPDMQLMFTRLGMSYRLLFLVGPV